MTLSATTAGCFLTKVYSSSFVCHWRKPIDLCRHDEIVLVETLDLLGAQRHSPIAPAEAKCRDGDLPPPQARQPSGRIRAPPGSSRNERSFRSGAHYP